MKFTEYQELAMRTASFMEPLDMLVHGAMGVGSEGCELSESAVKLVLLGTFDRENTTEELGDGLWFAAYCCETMGLSLHVVMQGELMPIHDQPEFRLDDREFMLRVLRICAAGGEVLTIVKAHRFYKKALDATKLEAAVKVYVVAICNLCELCGISISTVMKHNINKLKKRYGEKYSDTAAIARADKLPATPAAAAYEHLGLHPVDPELAQATALQGRTPSEADEHIFQSATGKGYTDQG